MKAKLWGNSAAIRLPKEVIDRADVKQGDDLEITVEVGGRTILRPQRPKYTLDELLDGVTGKNRPDETDWGRPMGKEAW